MEGREYPSPNCLLIFGRQFGDGKMPNIEIHGLSKVEADAVYQRIVEIFKGRPYSNEIVVTTHSTEVKDLKGKKQPFLRLVNSCQEHTEEIMHVLEILGMDIERGKLEEFRPKK